MKKLLKKWWFWLIIIILLIPAVNNQKSENTTQNSTENIITTDNFTEEKNSEVVTFLKGSNGQEFYKILCEVGSIPEKEGYISGDSIDYTSSNNNFGIEIETNKNNEVNWISIYTLKANDYENFFLAISRFEYNGSNRTECFNWIKDNLGNEAETKIGNANFKLYNGTSGKPILEVFTDGNEAYQQEQIDKNL